eukprot:TRINITY_DN3255_c0_g1_i2.p1 TRINITY_DN3255_c0_g1~~TRINITY_DN3255_c0_g1_i2.p1  ORF type:complete len:670 (-),score=150.90 TRINITY_DN3255_c0_g1_i2:798-2708(-)
MAASGDLLPVVIGGVSSLAGLTYLYLRSKSDDISRDLRLGMRIGLGKYRVNKIAQSTCWNASDFWEDTVKRNNSRVWLEFINDNGTTEKFTYTVIDELSNQVANWGASIGLKSKDVVALMMDNRPQFIIFWLGMAKLNVTIALINTNLRGRPLAHSLSISKASMFIIGNEHCTAVSEVRKSSEFAEETKGSRWFNGGLTSVDDYEYLDKQLAGFPVVLQVERPKDRNPRDTLFYVYTSGTTGLPKASLVPHFRFYFAGMGFAEALEMDANDILYCTLPLFHSAAGLAAVASSWYCGAKLLLRRKFSATHFFQDCKQHKATVFQYIGEVCRYLLSSPPTPYDRDHRLRMGFGNGLRPDIWSKFTERFNIPKLGEFYASSEGNASMINTIGTEGAMGFIPPLLARFVPLAIVKYDVTNDEIIRGSDGLCISCKDGEPGELLGKIVSTDATRDFAGYTDKKASEKKIVRDVLEKGDEYFRTGDLVRKDVKGHYYFVDRIGDTFRWKGENVSTGEVENVINGVPGIVEVNVYGVAVPGTDGRCGMASIRVDKDTFSLNELYNTVMRELPSYAAPLFVRIKEEMEITGTFKHKKTDLVQQGFDPNVVKDALYFRNDKERSFVELTTTLYNEICNGTTRSKL